MSRPGNPALSIHLRYRPGIDGLRAIAVSAVVLFHLNRRLLPGGFLGVDVFFVISGYLITSILLKDYEQDRFNLLMFYQRRIAGQRPRMGGIDFKCRLICVFVFINWCSFRSS